MAGENEETVNSEDIIALGDGFDMGVFLENDTEEESEEVAPVNVSDSAQAQAQEVVEEDAKKEKVANEENDDDVDGERGESNSSPTIYSSLAGVLAEQGILSSLDPQKDKIESIEDLIDTLNKEISNREFADLNENQKAYLQALRNGIPDENVKEYINLTSELNSITEQDIEDNEELRLELIKQDLISTGIAEEKAAKLARRSVDIGEDLDDAKDALANLKLKSQEDFKKQLAAKEQERIAQEKAVEESIKSLKTQITKTEEIIPGLKLNETIKNKLFEQMTKPVGKVGDQPINALQKKRMEDPMGFEIKMNYLFNITNGFEDFSKLVSKQKSKMVKDLESKLQGANLQSLLGTSGRTASDIAEGGDANDFTSGIGTIL